MGRILKGCQQTTRAVETSHGTDGAGLHPVRMHLVLCSGCVVSLNRRLSCLRHDRRWLRARVDGQETLRRGDSRAAILMDQGMYVMLSM